MTRRREIAVLAFKDGLLFSIVGVLLGWIALDVTIAFFASTTPGEKINAILVLCNVILGVPCFLIVSVIIIAVPGFLAGLAHGLLSGLLFRRLNRVFAFRFGLGALLGATFSFLYYVVFNFIMKG